METTLQPHDKDDNRIGSSKVCSSFDKLSTCIHRPGFVGNWQL